jgi:hypothetical protein
MLVAGAEDGNEGPRPFSLTRADVEREVRIVFDMRFGIQDCRVRQ